MNRRVEDDGIPAVSALGGLGHEAEDVAVDEAVAGGVEAAQFVVLLAPEQCPLGAVDMGDLVAAGEHDAEAAGVGEEVEDAAVVPALGERGTRGAHVEEEAGREGLERSDGEAASGLLRDHPLGGLAESFAAGDRLPAEFGLGVAFGPLFAADVEHHAEPGEAGSSERGSDGAGSVVVHPGGVAEVNDGAVGEAVNEEVGQAVAFAVHEAVGVGLRVGRERRPVSDCGGETLADEIGGGEGENGSDVRGHGRPLLDLRLRVEATSTDWSQRPV